MLQNSYNLNLLEFIKENQILKIRACSQGPVPYLVAVPKLSVSIESITRYFTNNNLNFLKNNLHCIFLYGSSLHRLLFFIQ